mgnify:CR=1 FL=1
MYDNAQLCDCEITDNCKQDKDKCSCKEYCCLYARSLASFSSPLYFTVSPRIEETSYTKICQEWRAKFYKMRRHIKGGIFVLELANGLRPHFHAVVDVVDKRGITATLFSWSRYDNVKKHGKYKNGFHYLFKDVEQTYEDTGIKPIYTYEQIKEEEDKKHLERCLDRLAQKQDNINFLNKDIPAWMRE